MQGCQFCRSLADGIHGRVFLDALYDQWNKTESWPSTGSHADVEEKLEGGSEKNNEAEEALGVEEDDDDESGWKDVSAFNEEFYEDELTGGWNAYEDKDTLELPCHFSMTLSFERGEDDLFTFLNVHLESIDQEEDNAVRRLRGERAVDLRYHTNSEDQRLDSRTADTYNAGASVQMRNRFFPLTSADTIIGSQKNMRHIYKWTQGTLKHSQFVTADSILLPRRLISVSPDMLRVVETATIKVDDEGSSKGFVALSYVWGLSQTFVLTTDTIDELESSFEILQLPQTIQDAIQVTRAIGLQYLWVDALCILQDSSADKTTELPKMRKIYESAAVTLIAAVARSATEGFLHHQIQTPHAIPPILIPSRTQSTYNIILSYPAAYERRSDPINLRAWTFQELLLSPRAILFSYRGLEFVDRNHIPAADGSTSGRDPQLPSLPWFSRLFRLTHIDPENLRSVWLTVRGEYSRRNLSYAGDKLVAISAVAEEIGQGYGGRYLAGLWEKDLESELKWSRADATYVNEPGTIQTKIGGRPSEYVAPSWSWAAIESPVDDFHIDGDAKPLEDKLGFKILSCEVKHAVPGFQYGAVVSGALHLHGRIHSFFWRPHNEKFISPDQTDGALAVKSEAEPHTELQVGEAILDALHEEIVDGCVVDVLAMGLIEQIPNKVEVEGLVLLPVGEEEEGKWRRVGFAKLRVSDLFKECQGMDVIVI
ncbi:hypothetical protein N0V90_002722 [Kalmusia sp. IMI 367209]|nr:hypothetical protein N0V90_002722 [Kalmusia sp. IMI 367209]